MVISPHTKPKLESETRIIGAHAGDPRVVAANAVDTPTEGTETPWRDTPPTNVSSTFETNNDHSPPHDPDTDPDDLDSMHEDLVPPEGEAGGTRSAGFRLGQDAPPIETRTAVEVFPPERESRPGAGAAAANQRGDVSAGSPSERGRKPRSAGRSADMGMAVVTVASGGMPVVDVTPIASMTPIKYGTPVTEATNGRGIRVTKVVGATRAASR